MPSKDNEDFLKKLLATFRIEADEHLKALSLGLIELEGAAEDQARTKVLETLLREAHSLKGAARAVNQGAIEAVCQVVESVFTALKRQELNLATGIFDTLHRAMDNLSSQLSAVAGGTKADKSPHIASVIGDLQSFLEPLPTAAESMEVWAGKAKPGVISGPEPPRSDKTAPEVCSVPQGRSWLAETVRIPAARLDSLLLEAEELISARLTASQRAAELHALRAELATWRKRWLKVYPELQTIRRELGRSKREQLEPMSEPLERLLEFLEWSSEFFKVQEGSLELLAMTTDQDHASLASMVEHLLEETRKVRMMPCSSLLEVFPQTVRGLSRDQGKEVQLIVRGGEIEVDRRILEEMKDALMHLVRNCIDHGIENPDERVANGKPPHGTLTIHISSREGNKVEILVADDGAGIDTPKILNTAAKLGLLPPEEAVRISTMEAQLLAFHSGVSTSPLITDISGRGLGLAIVREKVETLGGTVFVESRPNYGTTFRMVLPTTLATFRGIFVRTAGHLFVLPTAHVERVLRVPRGDVQTIENRDTIQVVGAAVALVGLADMLELPQQMNSEPPRDTIQAILLASADRRIAFMVDEIVGEEEVLVKDLGKQLVRVRNVAGATVTGTGEVVPLLHVADLMQSALKPPSARSSVGLGLPTRTAGKKSLLVVEDSITSRMLLKNILESAGYQVKTAVDGIDALTTLRAGKFDLLVSDVDMPRMSGFDLTARIRTDQGLAELPVVLVTALGSREDRERGLEVGANAYIVKSDFDQSNLLEVVRRLL